MSKMKDLWGDTIEVDADAGYVNVSFTERRPYGASASKSMELDADLTRKFIKKLKKALAVAEDA